MRTGLLDRLTGGTAAGGGPAPAAPAAAPAAGPSAGSADRPIRPPASLATRDPLDRLPEPAGTKAKRLRRENERAGIIIRELSGKRHRLATEKLDSQRYLDAVRASRANGRPRSFSTISTFVSGREPDGPFSMAMREPHGGRADEAQLRDAEARAAAAKEALDAMNAEIAVEEAGRSRLPERLTEWARGLPPGIKIELHRDAGASRKSAKPTTPEAVAELRDRIVALRTEISATRSAPPTSSEVKAVIRAQITEIAARGAPDCAPSLQTGRPLRLPELSVNASVAMGIGVGAAYVPMPDFYGFLAWLFGDEIVRKIEAQIDLISDDDNSLTAQQKAEKEQELLSKILDIERQEELLIEALELSGAAISRREDADPRAVLGLSGDLPATTSPF